MSVGGEDRYALLAASDGTSIANPDGLTTAECFEYLLDVRRRHPKRRLVAFGLNYDVNQWLRDISRGNLEHLWNTGRILATLSNGVTYRIEWIPGKLFSFGPFMEKTRCRVSDVFGFFQMSFVKSLEKWNVDDPHGNIARMKAERGTFKWESFAEVKAYCVDECRLLVALMGKLEESLASADLKPASWIGAGAVAASMLRREGVADHRVPDAAFPPAIAEAVQHAYFGGRTEVFLQGSLVHCTNYDLVSAYPSEALHLPTLAGGHWRRHETYDPRVRFGVWRVKWNVSPKYSVMPFPFRLDGAIYYPSNGAGWYHAKEVKAAMKLYPDHIAVEEGYEFVPVSTIEPFGFIRHAFAARQQAKAAGHASEKALKLGLNALYGKLAQGYGYRGKTPPFQSFFWAGAITAGTRARLLDLAAWDTRSVVSTATDGIVFTGDPDYVESKNLGGLEKTRYKSIFIAQPGIYRAETDTGEEIRRSRGFFTREIDYDDLERGWLRDGPQYTQARDSTRFVGLGSALLRGDMDVWRRWVTSERRISLYSSRKFYDPRLYKGRVMRLFPPEMPADAFSEKFKPKKRGMDVEDVEEFVAGMEQPLIDY